MPLVLKMKAEPTLALEVDSVRLENVVQQTPSEIAQTLVQCGNRSNELGQYFEVSGSAQTDQTMVWQGDCSRVKRIGERLSTGKVLVEGNAGNHLGADMTGGSIKVTGNVGNWVGAEMTGGRIEVGGDAGDSLGAAYRGAQVGMRGGEIFVQGNAGNEVGHGMRRGFIAVKGSVGDAAGFKMLAGTLMFFGAVGVQLGAGMKRGSIVCFDRENVASLLPTFLPASEYTPQFISLYLNRLKQCGWTIDSRFSNRNYQRYCGDFVETARGEILVLTP